MWRHYRRLVIRDRGRHRPMTFARSALQFVPLADRLEVISLVAGWWFDEWGHERPGASRESFAADLRAEIRGGPLPVHLLALRDDSMVGVAVLKLHELADLYPDLQHWLTGVYVAPGARGRGIASALAIRILEAARALSLTTVHLQTEALDGGLYAKLGWKPIDRIVRRGIERLVMARTI
jgi:GNAT superfamily N-acetyltransferase